MGEQISHPAPVAAPAKTAPAQKSSVRSTVHADVNELTFSSVAGHWSMPQVLALVNNGDKFQGMHLVIEGDAAAAAAFTAGPDGAILPPSSTNRPPTEVGVRYSPLAAGKHTASLAIRHDDGEERISLQGTALPAAESGTPREGDAIAPAVIGEVPRLEPGATKRHAREELLRTASTLATLPANFDAVTAGADSAAAEFQQRLMAAGGHLNSRLVQWIQEEGLETAGGIRNASQDSGAVEFLKFALLKVGEMGAHVYLHNNPLAALALAVVDLGWSMFDAHTANKEAAHHHGEMRETLTMVGDHAAGAADDVTRELMKRFGGLMSRFAGARATMAELAGGTVSEVLNHIGRYVGGGVGAEAPADLLASANTVLDQYRRAQDRFAYALRELAAEGILAQSRGEVAFARIIDEYVQFRARGDSHSTDPVDMEFEGTINFEPFAISMHGRRVGEFEGREMSSTVGYLIDTRHVSDLVGADVAIKLSSVQGGRVWLHQGADGTREQKITGEAIERVSTLGGASALWMEIDSRTMGTRR